MEMVHKYAIEAYMNALYGANPQGSLLERARQLEQQLVDFAEKNPGAADIMGESGLRDEYNRLYMAAVSGESSEAKASAQAHKQQLPTVHEFLETYRQVYENSVKPYDRKLTEEAYMKLFDVENRTDDLIEAQLIIEREHLVLNTVTADYKAIAEEFIEAADPNYEITSAAVKASIGTYAGAGCLEEITYMGELAKATCDDLAVQLQLKVEMMLTFMSLLNAWAHTKRQLREGTVDVAAGVRAMVVTRKKTRDYYRFLSEDMGITFDVMENTPFFRISLLNPQGMDELWRIKKIMHPDNIKAMRYMLFEEILSDRSMEEILLTPQPYPYFEAVDSVRHPEINREYEEIAGELNSNIRYFEKYGKPGIRKDPRELIKNTNKLNMSMARNIGDAPGGGGNSTFSQSIRSKVPETGKNLGKEIGKGLLRSLFRR
ncbi:MAG: hypothetical protein PUB75_07570 [Firmicutes bacterium]|nr:hypothetical protein [Bacillota bacterium]